MLNIPEIFPRWILVNGDLHHVSSFSHLPPGQRPEAHCPVCKKPVILKLGNDRVHHYAHQADDQCAITQPETALHFNTKIYIGQQLKQADTLFVEQNCVKNHFRICEKTKEIIWAQEWNEVEVEYSLDKFRPDVALLSDGQVIAAIEVFVTHPVDEQKAQYFAQQNIPWIEVQASEDFYDGENAWTSKKPLPFRRIQPSLQKWICPNCEDFERDREEEQRKRQEENEYAKRNYESIHSARMVDFYYKSGKKYREVYFLMQKVSNGEVVKMWVKTEKNKILASEVTPINHQAIERLKAITDTRILEFRNNGTLVDEVVEWRLWQRGTGFVARDTSRFPYRYTWRPELREWKLYWE